MKAADARKALKRAQSDPDWWVRNVLGESPWAKQSEILAALVTEREVNVRSCHSAGKSWIASRAALWFLYSHPRSLVVTTAPTSRQVRGIIWREIATAHRQAAFPLGGKLNTMDLKIDEDWLAVGFTAAEHDPDRFQGFHAKSVLVIVDEACGISEQIDAAVDSILSGEHCRLLRIGNPTDVQTPFGESFKKQRGRRFKISAFDTPNFTELGITAENFLDWERVKGDRTLPMPSLSNPGWVADKATKWGIGSPLWQSRIAAEFPEAGENSLIPLRLIEAAQNADISAEGQVVWGVDVARQGSDETAILGRCGDVVKVLATFHKSSTMETAGRIAKMYREAGDDAPEAIHVDEIGVGAGVLDRLVEMGLPARGINVGSGAVDRERFVNLRAELYWNLRDRFEAGTISIPEDDDLAGQLAAQKYFITSAGKIQLEKKAEQTKSPDRADALAMAFAPVRKPRTAAVFDLSDAGLRVSPWGL